MDIKKICLLVLVITIYLLLGFFRLGGLMAYVVPSICWSLLAIIAIYICGPRKIRLWFSKPLTTMAVLIALLQISALVFSAFFTAFGRSPYAHTPIAIMIGMTYFSSALFGMEFSRAYLIKSCPKRKVSMGISPSLYIHKHTINEVHRAKNASRNGRVHRFRDSTDTRSKSVGNVSCPVWRTDSLHILPWNPPSLRVALSDPAKSRMAGESANSHADTDDRLFSGERGR